MTKNILITAYDVNPYKGSESATGWNFPINIASQCDYNITVVTRENNKADIEKYLEDNPEFSLNNLRFEYFDLPYKYRFWKKGSKGATLYYYLWQFFVVYKVKNLGKFDIYHALNFHTDAFPSFLWRLNGCFIWGPISHHEPIPLKFLNYYPTKEIVKECVKILAKKMLWCLDPFLKKCLKESSVVISGHSKVESRLGIIGGKKITMNQVASTESVLSNYIYSKTKIQFVTVARCVPLKGIDLLLDAFVGVSSNLKKMNADLEIDLLVIGDGPYLDLYKSRYSGYSNIRFTGWIAHDDVYRYLKNSDIFAFPSHEGAGMVVAEAASLALPIICLDNYGPGELLPEEYPFKVSTNGNRNQVVNELGSKMLELALNNHKRIEISNLVLRHFQSNMTWKAKASKVITIYESFL